MAQENDPFRQGLSIAARIGMELVVTTLVGAFLGYLVDRWLGTKPWFMIAGVLFGAATGFRNVYRLANPPEEQKENEKED
ncbi:MAG TPA: AtpZ/AtpI family protein [Nitrospiria bacterium]